jgi:lipoprotein NlpI
MFYKGDLSAASADFSAAIRLDPGDGMAFHNRGIVRYLAGDIAGARSDFNRSLALDQGNAYARIWRLAVSGKAASSIMKNEHARYARRAVAWPNILSGAFVGRVSEAELLRRAAGTKDPALSARMRAEAFYYLGLRNKTIEGRLEQAEDYFRKCLETGAVMSHARRLAGYELSGE